jgi:uncharacterized membrane protein YhaH (DUF805 family)
MLWPPSWFLFADFGVLFAVGLVDQVVGNDVLGFITMLALTIAGLAVAARCRHDTHGSGAWFLISFVPFGLVVLPVFACQDSAPARTSMISRPS